MIGFLLKIFKPKGCLHNKTNEEKSRFFNSLSHFATTDSQFFKEQYFDLLLDEQKEFCDWVVKNHKENNKLLVSVIESLIEHNL